MAERMNIVTMLSAWWGGDLRVSSLPTLPLLDGEIHMVPSFIGTINDAMDIGGRADSQDSGYQKVSDELFTPRYLKCYYKWIEETIDREIGYDSRTFDCDDYALSYWLFCRLLYSRQKEETVAQSPLVGYAKSSTLRHTFNFAITQSGLRFYDPQHGPMVKPDGIYWMQF
jgi:hypothetical protein